MPAVVVRHPITMDTTNKTYLALTIAFVAIRTLIAVGILGA